MEIHFSKYEGAGNDFITIDMTSAPFAIISEQIQRMCNRKTGIGADGLLVLKKSEIPDCKYRMQYYNSDGKEGSLCGNGSRCSLAFAERIGLVRLEPRRDVKFEVCDGLHYGNRVSGDDYVISVNDVTLERVRQIDEQNYFLDNGSPHHVRIVGNVSEIDVKADGEALRWGRYGQTGSNINFMEVNPERNDYIFLRTFERGVEDETLACGSGATAAAIVAYLLHRKKSNDVDSGIKTVFVSMKGGMLEVSFRVNRDRFYEVRLRGPAKHVFDGKIILSTTL